MDWRVYHRWHGNGMANLLAHVRVVGILLIHFTFKEVGTAFVLSWILMEGGVLTLRLAHWDW
jgi:hypothetical protein